MSRLQAEVQAEIRGSHDAWSLSADDPGPSRVVQVRLAIMGDEQNGFHLIQNPKGFLAVDTWHRTLDEALDVARELFGVRREAWS